MAWRGVLMARPGLRKEIVDPDNKEDVSNSVVHSDPQSRFMIWRIVYVSLHSPVLTRDFQAHVQWRPHQPLRFYGVLQPLVPVPMVEHQLQLLETL